jgi:hypothetical protein
MAALDYYLGASRGSDLKRISFYQGTTSDGASVDVELRMQMNNGTVATNLTRKDVIIILTAMIAFLQDGGVNKSGTNLPPVKAPVGSANDGG